MATIVSGDFEWDHAKAEVNLAKHGISFEEASTAFDDPDSLEATDMVDPTRLVLIGRSHVYRVLFVIHAERGARIRLISARKASPVQRRKYEEGI
jgi:uncharacterized DUF497 family protein